MRALLSLVTLLVACATSTGANEDEEPLIVPKPLDEPAPRARAAWEREHENADKVVVMPLSSTALDADLVSSLDRVLITRVDWARIYDVISPDDIGSLLGVERLKDAAGCNDVTCAADFAGALDARFVLYGVIDELGGRLNITLSLVDAREQRVRARSQVAVDKDETVYEDAIDAVVARLLGDTEAPTSISAAPRDRSSERRDSLASAAPAPEPLPARLDDSVTGVIFVDIPGRALIGDTWSGQRQIETRDAESAIVARWTAVGFEALDRVLVGEPSLDKLREHGALYWIVGEATGGDSGSIMGTQMHSLNANVSARVVEVASGRVVATSKQTSSAGHINLEAGIGRAMDQAGTRCAEDLLSGLLAHLGGTDTRAPAPN